MRDGALVALAAAGLALAACASTTVNLQRATAAAIDRNVLPESISIQEIDRRASSVTWTAVAPTGTYSCTADDMVRRPYCASR
ncbi:hypothetical protein AAFN86_28180 [Roseomonas sp. CAU 1739]|uniref:hypothetical protein n=1 Tax=Roseomonas sp. CAU 1739 TaxID=3140364 RepID=UPI00325C2C70